MWRGLPGRESTYVYVQSGSASVSLGMEDGQVEHRKWWKITDTVVEEVSEDTVLNDPTGMHMYNGGGSLLHAYVHKEKDEAARVSMRIPDVLLQAVKQDNAELDLANAKSQDVTQPAMDADSTVKPVEAAQTVEAESTKDAEMEGPESQGAVTQVDPDEDVQMASESQKTRPLQVEESNAPLRLSGGSSAPRRVRRSSVTSDTGSIASTSKVKIGDEEDQYDSEEEGDVLVELGFAEKLNKKGFKVVKDVGKIGGKPVGQSHLACARSVLTRVFQTWLNPALPLQAEQTVCNVCGARMEFLMQINAPLEEIPAAIYRTFYVYSCRKASCLDKPQQGR